jgi:hypothetical protein
MTDFHFDFGTSVTRTVRRWIVPEDGQMAVESSSFMQLPFWTEQNGFNAINSFQVLGVAGGREEQYLMSLQRADAFTVSQKRAWLINTEEGTPPNSPYWYKDGQLVYGSCLMSDNQIEITNTEYVLGSRYRTEPATANHPIAFYKVLGLRASELMTTNYTHENKPTKIHNIGTAWKPNSAFTPNTPKGIIYSPVWDQRDYPCNAGTMYYAKAYTV